MSKAQDKPNNEPTEIDEMFRKLEENGDYSGIENFASKVIPKIAKIINKLHPEQNSFTGFVKKDEEKENTADNVGYYFYTSTEPVVDLGKNKQPLEVSISSTEQENEQLLHFLFDKSRLANDCERTKHTLEK
jgi:hypothetical protein